MVRVRTASPISLRHSAALDWSYSVRAISAPTHKRIIVRNDTDDAALWTQTWQPANPVQLENGQWEWSYTAPKARVSLVQTAQFAGKQVTIELWQRRADGRELEDFAFNVMVA